jgi:hypothetical protein
MYVVYSEVEINHFINEVKANHCRSFDLLWMKQYFSLFPKSVQLPTLSKQQRKPKFSLLKSQNEALRH